MTLFLEILTVLTYIYAAMAAFALWTTRRRVIDNPEQHDPGPWCEPQPRQWGVAEIGLERQAS